MPLTLIIGWWSVLDDADKQGAGESDWDINGDEFTAQRLLGSTAFYSLTVAPDSKDSTKALIYVSVYRYLIFKRCLCVTDMTHFQLGLTLSDITMMDIGMHSYLTSYSFCGLTFHDDAAAPWVSCVMYTAIPG